MTDARNWLSGLDKVLSGAFLTLLSVLPSGYYFQEQFGGTGTGCDPSLHNAGNGLVGTGRDLSLQSISCTQMGGSQPAHRCYENDVT